MGRLSDNKLEKLKKLSNSGGFWYITKQNLVFRDLCFMAKILDAWNDRNDENYEDFFNRHKTLPEYGSLSSLLAHRATKNCEYIGLTKVSSKYSAQNLTPFYFALKKLCNGDFNNLSFYPNIIDKQLERIFINSISTTIFNICPFMFLFKILLLIGDISGVYRISITEFKLFVATAQKWNEYFEVIESILRYRNDEDYKNECAKNTAKVNDVRYNVLAQNHSQLEVNESTITLCENAIKDVRRKVSEYELSEKIYSTEDIFASDIVPLPLIAPLQQIYYGAPGTGKSHTINEVTKSVDSDFVYRTTFHPDSDYSTFVGAYKPTMKPRPVRNVAGDVVKKDGVDVMEDVITYSFVPQTFIKAYVKAWQNPGKPVYLVIEEINRGNCAQIFGDLFQLLDRDENGVSEYPIKADQDIKDYLAKAFAECEGLKENIKSGEELMLPSNLYIWATMNTSDQSLFPIDSAFKRRWDWVYVPIENAEKGWTIKVGDKGYDWWDFLDKVNEEIGDLTSSEDKKLGYFFCKADDENIISLDKFISKVLFYLWNDVFKMCGKDYKVRDEKGDETDKLLTFDKFYTAENQAKLVQNCLEKDLKLSLKTKETTIEATSVPPTGGTTSAPPAGGVVSATSTGDAVEETSTEGAE